MGVLSTKYKDKYLEIIAKFYEGKDNEIKNDGCKLEVKLEAQQENYSCVLTFSPPRKKRLSEGSQMSVGEKDLLSKLSLIFCQIVDDRKKIREHQIDYSNPISCKNNT